MLANRIFANSIVSLAMVMMMGASPLLQTALAQKRGIRDDLERAPAAREDQPTPNAQPTIAVANQPKPGGKVSADVIRPSSPSVCTQVTATQSTSQAITPGNSAGLTSMGTDPPGAFIPTSLWRYFNVASFSGGAVDVQSVDIGVEYETGPSKLVTVNLYTSAVQFPLLYPSSLTLIGSAQMLIGNQTGTIVNIPVLGHAPAGSQLVVEINVPFTQGVNTGTLLVGSNSATENAPSYISTSIPFPGGILSVPTTTGGSAYFPYPNMHVVMNVHGCGSAPVPSAGSAAASPWTTAGSAGTIDEDSSSIVQISNFTLGLMPGATGTVTSRYNITGVAGLSRFCPATTSKVSIRFRDSDGTGPAAQVVLEIHRSNPDQGGNDIIYAFDSNGSAQSVGSAFQSFSTSPAIDFDFETYIYWIEAKVTKTDPGTFANLGSIKISETAGTACQ